VRERLERRSHLVIEEVESTFCVKRIECRCHGINSITGLLEKGGIKIQEIDGYHHADLRQCCGEKSIPNKDLAHRMAGTDEYSDDFKIWDSIASEICYPPKNQTIL